MLIMSYRVWAVNARYKGDNLLYIAVASARWLAFCFRSEGRNTKTLMQGQGNKPSFAGISTEWRRHARSIVKKEDRPKQNINSKGRRWVGTGTASLWPCLFPAFYLFPPFR